MIAFAGHQRLAARQHAPLAYSARPRWPMEGLPSLSERRLGATAV